MTSNRTEFGTVMYKSERFNRDWKEYQTNAVFFEDNDPRIQLITDKYGDEMWLVGYTEPIPLTAGYAKDIPKHLLIIRVKDNALMSIDPSVLV